MDCFARQGDAKNCWKSPKIPENHRKFEPLPGVGVGGFGKFFNFVCSITRKLAEGSTWNLHRSCPACCAVRKNILSHWGCFARLRAATIGRNPRKSLFENREISNIFGVFEVVFGKKIEFANARSRNLPYRSSWNLHMSCPECSSMCKNFLGHWGSLARLRAAIIGRNPRKSAKIRPCGLATTDHFFQNFSTVELLYLENYPCDHFKNCVGVSPGLVLLEEFFWWWFVARNYVKSTRIKKKFLKFPVYERP